MNINCPCQDDANYMEWTQIDQWDEIKDKFNYIRERCDAIKVLMPDKQWEIIKYYGYRIDNAAHQPMCLLQYHDQKQFKKTARIIHEFVIGENQATNDYKNSLLEKWHFVSDKNPEIDRHRNSRQYLGKLHELMFAWKLKENGFSIDNMEAWQKYSPDIQATKNNISYSLECKYIGINDNTFKIMFDNNYPNAGGLSLTDTSNYILFKSCEAAEQLKKQSHINGNKTAIIIIEVTEKRFFKIALSDGSFDINNPSFYKHEELKNNLIKNNPNKEQLYTDIFRNPVSYLSDIDNFIVYGMTDYNYEYIASYKPAIDFEFLL